MANETISQLDEVTTTSGDDILPIVVNISTTPVNKKIKVSNLVVTGTTVHSKTLTNNTSNALFTFPLPSGETETISIIANVLAKKTTDWAIFGFNSDICIYNDGSNLQKTATDTPFNEIASNSGAVSFAAASLAAGNGTLFTFALNAGVVTVSINPGNVGSSPDSIVINYVVTNPSGKTITYL